MNSPGCTPDTKEEAEYFLTSAFNSDWSPSVIEKGKKAGAKSDEEPLEPSTNAAPHLRPLQIKNTGMFSNYYLEGGFLRVRKFGREATTGRYTMRNRRS